MSTKKLIATLLAVVMAVGVLAGCGNDFGSNETAAPAADTAIAPAATVEAAEGLDTENTYKVGVLMPLSGDLSFFSAYFQPILDIYQADINANGGINGHALELVYKDTQGDATITAQRLDEMTDEKVSAVIGPFMDPCGPAAAQWAKENKTPVSLVCGLSTDIGMANASEYVFCAGSNPWIWSKIYANEVVKAGYKSAYYIGNEGGVPDNVYDYFWAEMAKLDPEVANVGSVRLNGSETDFSSIITSIMAAKPQVVFTSLTGGTAITFIQQAAQFGLFDDIDLYGVYIAGADHTESVGSAYPVGRIESIDWFPVNFSFSKDWAREIYTKAGNVIPNGASLNFYYALDTVCKSLATMDYEARNDGAALVKAMEEVKVASPLDANQEVYYTSYNHQLVFPHYFCGTVFDPDWGNIALTDESNYTVYGFEVYPTATEWRDKAVELNYTLPY